MVERGGLVLGLALMAGLIIEAAPGAQETDSASTTALKYFAELPNRDIGTNLHALRPPRISAAERAYALATLPERGELSPDAGDRRKLTSLQAILSYHDRANMDIKVVDLPYAAIGIHQRAVLLISRPLLRLLSARELQAAVAHEIGHEYFWKELEYNGGLPTLASRRQTVELKCDGIAALTLLGLGRDVSTLRSAMTKAIQFNRSIGLTKVDAEYPTLADRDIFVRALLKMQRSRFKKERPAN